MKQEVKPSNPQSGDKTTTFSLTITCEIPEKLLAETLSERGRLTLLLKQEGNQIILVEEETGEILCESTIEGARTH